MNETSDRWIDDQPTVLPMPEGMEPVVLPGAPEMKHLDGVPWHEAPVPSRFHRCTPQTKGYVYLELVERCACGAIRMSTPRLGRSHWMEKNQTRKSKNR